VTGGGVTTDKSSTQDIKSITTMRHFY
jgi:hypothetical protein